MSQQLYMVRVEIEQLVLAESEDEARTICENARCMVDTCQQTFADDYEVSRATHIPSGWDSDCLVYHNGKVDISVAEALKIDPYMNERAEKNRAMWESRRAVEEAKASASGEGKGGKDV